MAILERVAIQGEIPLYVLSIRIYIVLWIILFSENLPVRAPEEFTWDNLGHFL